MHCFYLPADQCQGPRLNLHGREAHHALHVLRLRRGERVTVLDGGGQRLSCAVETLERDSIQLQVGERTSIPRRPFELTLLQGIPKGKTFETIIQKATELGVHRIIPLLTERCEVHLSGERSEHKQDKWQTIAIEALKQSGNPWLPQVDPPITPAEFLQRRELFGLNLVAAIHPESQHPSAFLPSPRPAPFSCAIWIGPEGDFAPDELRTIRAAGAQPISLGPIILRADTAAIYCLSVLNYEFSRAQPGDRK